MRKVSVHVEHAGKRAVRRQLCLKIGRNVLGAIGDGRDEAKRAVRELVVGEGAAARKAEQAERDRETGTAARLRRCVGRSTGLLWIDPCKAPRTGTSKAGEYGARCCSEHGGN